MPDAPASDPPALDPQLTPEQLAILEEYNGEFTEDNSPGNNPPGTKSPPIPGMEFLGIGYDVFGLYASVDSCKQPILDFSAEPEIEQQVIDASLPLETLATAFNTIPIQIKLFYRRPEKVTYLPLFKVTSEKEFESTLDEQITKWSTHSNVDGHYGLFSAEVDARFSSNLAKLATTKYYSLASKSTYWQLSLNYSIGHPAPLRPEVQEDLDNEAVKPAEFFDKYGTHYLGAVLIGCRVTISCAIETSNIDSDFDFSSYLEATYGSKKGGVSTSNETTYQNKVKKFREHSRTSVSGVGISDAQLKPIGEGAEASVEVLKGGWHNPSLVDFPRHALKPIWQHCKNDKQRLAFAAEFDKQAAERGSILSDLALYTAMYLYRQHGKFASYRIYPSSNLVGSHDSGGVTWTIENGGRPLFYLLARQLEGSVPLYQYRWKSDNRLWRYEAGAWADWMNDDPIPDNHWQRVSATPLGYVLEPEATLARNINSAALCPLYAYCPRDRGNDPRYFYSLDSDDHSREPAEVWRRFDMYRDDKYGRYSPATPGGDSPAAPEGSRPKYYTWTAKKLAQWYAWSRP
jgi:hypothetical protein